MEEDPWEWSKPYLRRKKGLPTLKNSQNLFPDEEKLSWENKKTIPVEDSVIPTKSTLF